MNARACVTTAAAPAAIAAIRLEGADAAAILAAIIRTADGKRHLFRPGDIVVGELVDGPDMIDHVVIACPNTDSFEINCHGNPLVVAAAMRLLKDRGALLISAEQMLHDRCRPDCCNTIEIEARLEQLKAVTLEGASIIARQAESGLAKTARQWSDRLDWAPLEEVKHQCGEILARSRTAKLLIRGCRIIIAGRPNSGKSTLLNALAGRRQAIVADVPGTTRDWVTASCRVGPLAVEFVDTAGLDPTLTGDSVDQAAQAAALQLLGGCDLVLHVIDASRPGPIDAIPAGCPVIAVFNKSDLPPRITPNDLPFPPAATVTLNALHANGLETLAETIQTVLAVDAVHWGDPICFTDRQAALVTQLADATDKSSAGQLITELLTAPLSL